MADIGPKWYDYVYTLCVAKMKSIAVLSNLLHYFYHRIQCDKTVAFCPRRSRPNVLYWGPNCVTYSYHDKFTPFHIKWM